MEPDNPADGRAAVVPAWLRRTLACGAGFVLIAVVCWIVGRLLLRVAVVSFALAVAVLLTALIAPLTERLRRLGTPSALAALAGLVLLLGFPTVVGLLLWSRAADQVDDVVAAVTAGVDNVRSWLVNGPLSLAPGQIEAVSGQVTGRLQQLLPDPVAGATTALHVMGGLALSVFTVFFLLKDGPRMWQWLLDRTPPARRATVDAAGRRGWQAVSAYAVGATVVALADAVLIGGALLILGVSLWLSLMLLVFLAAFVPFLGALVSGTAAVLVTLVTNNFRDAVIIAIVVVVVQQLEGNILQPLVMGHAVELHPVVIVVAVTCGSLVLGIPGAILATPVVAVAYQVIEELRTRGTTLEAADQS